MKVVVLGGSGMLGSMVADYLSRDKSLDVHATVRSRKDLDRMAEALPAASWSRCDARDDDVQHDLPMAKWYINCIGVTKPRIDESSIHSVIDAAYVNSIFPGVLSETARVRKARVIQIATDCVYSGAKGAYVESDEHDAHDVYGKTKSLGEVPSEYVHHLRCSIVGPEAIYKRHLLEWLLGQPEGSTVFGYAHHLWNGITTLHFAKLCHAIITNGIAPPRLQHIVPGNYITKAKLLRLIANAYGRQDLTLSLQPAAEAIDRTLATEDIETNKRLWRLAGYEEPPTIAQMIEELAQYDYLSKPPRARA